MKSRQGSFSFKSIISSLRRFLLTCCFLLCLLQFVRQRGEVYCTICHTRITTKLTRMSDALPMEDMPDTLHSDEISDEPVLDPPEGSPEPGIKMNARATVLEKISNELKLFFAHCKDNKLTNDEIFNICKPILNDANISVRIYPFAIMGFIIPIVVYLLSMGVLSTHLYAVGRICLIEALPLWNWRNMNNQKCLISNFFQRNKITEPTFDCALCESIDKISVIPNIEQKFLKEHYLDLHNPVIIKNALDSWNIHPNYIFPNNDSFVDSIPCKLSTNIYNGVTNVGEILARIKNFETYFLHFQNCDFKAMKEFRAVTPKPNFIPVDMSPVQYSWILISKNYDVDKFKAIELKESVTVVGQKNGSNVFQLIPTSSCEMECSPIRIELLKGEALVFTSMWNLEYKPNMDGENFAVILEMH